MTTSDNTIDITGLDKASVLMALYDAAKPQGMGFIHFVPGPLERPVAERLVSGHLSFDYLKGRVMKVDISGDTIDPWGYDRDNGPGAARRALEIAGMLKETNK